MLHRLAGVIWKKPVRLNRARLLPGSAKKKRVWRAGIPLGFSRRLVISLRRFRTPAHRRSARYKQFVWQPRLLRAVSFRELAIAIQPHKKRVRKPVRAMRFTRSIFQLSDQAILSVFLLIGGLTGSVYFSMHLNSMPRLYLGQNTQGTANQQLAKSGSLFASQLQRHQKVDLIKPVADVKPAPPPALPKVLPRSEPARIRIPKIALDTSIMPESLGPSGTIAMPNVFDRAAWYNQSPTPGERGPSIITGHVDSPHNIAIFWRLRELLPGDIVQVDRRDGTTATFAITDIQQLPQDQFPTQAVYGNLDYAGLRVITCGGTFNTLTGHYSHNTVVYGKLAQ